jgi:hypothetical protein
MRNNRSRHTAINNLLSELAPKAQPKAATAKVEAATVIAKFLSVTKDLRLENHLPEVKGQWMSAPSPYKWGDVNGGDEKASTLFANGKAQAKSLFVKGNRVMVHLKDLAA